MPPQDMPLRKKIMYLWTLNLESQKLCLSAKNTKTHHIPKLWILISTIFAKNMDFKILNFSKFRQYHKILDENNLHCI